MEIPVDLADEGHFHDCAVDYAKKVNDMTGGRLTAPSFGWDFHGLLGWFYHGGGEALYNELVNEILKVNTASCISPGRLSPWAGSRARSPGPMICGKSNSGPSDCRRISSASSAAP